MKDESFSTEGSCTNHTLCVFPTERESWGPSPNTVKEEHGKTKGVLTGSTQVKLPFRGKPQLSSNHRQIQQGNQTITV